MPGWERFGFKSVGACLIFGQGLWVGFDASASSDSTQRSDWFYAQNAAIKD
jgi:hypothetical protein